MQKRKHPRLKQYDYSQPGAYFITFCTKNRELLLSGIIQPDPYAPAVTRLTEIGRIVEGKLRELPIGISLDKWVIMPNHVHLLVTIEQTSEAKIELSQFVRMVKSKSSHAAGRPLWQSSFYEHVVRGEKDYLEIWDYIDQNPAKWIEDEYYSEESSMKNLQKQFPTPVLQSWAFLLGGGLALLVFQPWTMGYVPNGYGLLGIACVVIIGNILAFTCYMQGVKLIGAQKASLYSFAEPVTAAIISTFVLGSPFTMWDALGFACIFIMLVLLSLPEKKRSGIETAC